MAKSVFPLCTSSRTVKNFDSCLFWLSLFVYIQAATVSCAEAAMSLPHTHTHTHTRLVSDATAAGWSGCQHMAWLPLLFV